MTEIGKIDKPEIAQFKDKKKIYYVRNLFLPKNATDEYKSIFNQYWKEVEEHLTKIEAAGKVAKIFCESIYMEGEESMKVLQSMNVHLEQIVRKKIDAGGEFIPLEDKDTFGACIDWNNCLMLVRTPQVYETVHGFLKEAINDRFEFIQAILHENIRDKEAGLLFMRDEDRKFLHLNDDIEFFVISPPAYDDLIQFISNSNSGKEVWRNDDKQ